MKKFLLVLAFAFMGCTTAHTYVDESPFTMSNWRLAIENRNNERYELAYHYYSLALASARTEAGVLRIKSEMEAMERVIQATR